MTFGIQGEIQPLYFPTTIALVDDHEEYLEVVPLLLDPMLHVHAFNSPRCALSALNHHSRIIASNNFYRWKEPPSRNQELIALDIDSIHRMVYDPERFSEVSVVMVDQLMEEMHGIDFCTQLSNPHVGKILLTGQADDAMAVEAFNAGVIDYFIRKNDPQFVEKLQQAIVTLQHRYFKRTNALLAEALALGDFRFLRDKAFQEVLKNIAATFQPVESYVYINPTGLLLIDAWGFSRFLLVQTEEDLRAHYEIAADYGAPSSLLAALRDGGTIPWFYNSRDGFYHDSIHDPETALYPASIVQGEQWYYYALIDQVEHFHLQLRQIKSYRSWLREQDMRTT